MAIIRRYGLYPAFFVPDEGERVLASRSPAGPFCEAYVTLVRRASRDTVRIDFVWQETDPVSPYGTGVHEGEKGHVYVSTGDTVPLIRRIPYGYRRRQNTDPPPDARAKDP
jgi:hypothetical protein